MGLWTPLAQLGHAAIGLLVGRLLTLDKALCTCVLEAISIAAMG